MTLAIILTITIIIQIAITLAPPVIMNIRYPFRQDREGQ